MEAVDIMMCTHNRLEMLRTTVTSIIERTMTPYKLKVIDIASTDGTEEYLRSLEVLHHRHEKRTPMIYNYIDMADMSSTDPFVITDDDALCPKIQPDWLYRLLDAMKKRPDLYMLGLNNPSDNITGSRLPYKDDGEVIYSRYSNGHYLLIRKELHDVSKELFRGDVKIHNPAKALADYAHKKGMKVGYLRDVYVWHFCPESVRRPGKDWSEIMVTPVDMDTLEPPEEYRQWKIA
jgi:glycosyltransferase involved in cell wall biosynthesis